MSSTLLQPLRHWPTIAATCLLPLVLAAAAEAGEAQASTSTPNDAATTSLPAAAPLVFLDGHSESLPDPTGLLQIQEVLQASGFTPSGRGMYSKPLNPVVGWLRLFLINPSDVPQERYLELGSPLIDDVQAYVLRGDGSTTHYSLGENTALEDRPVPYILPQIPLTLAPGERVTVCLRLEDEGAAMVPLTVGYATALAAQSERRERSEGMLCGVLLLVAFYSLLLFATLRIPVLAWLATFMGSMMGLMGLFFWWDLGYLLPAEIRPHLSNRLIVVFAELSAFTLVNFVLCLLEIHSHRPAVHKWISRASFALPISAALTSVLPYSLSLSLWMLQAVVLLPAIVCVIIDRARVDRIAALVGIGVAVQACSVLLILLRVTAVLPSNMLIENMSSLGNLLLITFIIAAVIARLRLLDQQHREALEARLHEAQRTATIREAFGRYVNPDLAEDILRNPQALKPGGSLEMVTVMMSDLRGFTRLTTSLGPRGMIELLNRYFDKMTKVIVRHNGMINEFIGDAILALFGAPDPEDDDAQRAVLCALEMQEALDEFNRENAEQGLPPLHMGIGLHSGLVVLGNIGSDQHVKYGVVGDTVNMCGRIESLTVSSQVLISAATHMLAGEEFVYDDPLTVSVKGLDQPITVFPVLGKPDQKSLLASATAMVPLLPVRWEAQLALVMSKVVEDSHVTVHVSGARGDRLEIQGPAPLAPAQDVQLKIQRQEGGWTAPINAKVTRASSMADDDSDEGVPSFCCTLSITSTATPIGELLARP